MCQAFFWLSLSSRYLVAPRTKSLRWREKVKIPIIGTEIDERFPNHRLRSSSLGGIIVGLTAIGLFFYRFSINHVWSGDLFVVIAHVSGSQVVGNGLVPV